LSLAYFKHESHLVVNILKAKYSPPLD